MTFEEFAVQQATPLLRYATVLTGDPHLAQDVVQEVLLRAQQRWARISAVDSPGAYVKRMVTNEFLSWRRRRQFHLTLDDASHAADPTTSLDDRDALLGLVGRLPRKQRAALVLRYFEDWDDVEIAAALGCSEVTVRSHISRALATLRAADLVKEST
ncbi:SigE family RNA polymerase sigma factor [Saccharothrix violaceirubra]|uniref:RNA polymerase sigma-70 factor (Sigma-E family) n=1 Tax=Saccharothrix violaceirubra TaxID=413306 RepID=A0A7W7SYE6_9PSEU|nr:SigE family RNA polymerase sigma factor [Saccharothrix violaceirubra]MBB4963247.1 RNA polymerase sigma-70 factor (sigma-E family) [Saccharothrix violaceirubra]